MAKKLCLLRGINVGGKNIIKMDQLRLCLERLELEDVRTYIQSGNVMFDSAKTEASLGPLIEKALLKKFSYKEPILIMSAKKLESIVSSAPKAFGSQPDKYRYDVIFLIGKKLTAKQLAKVISLKEGVDTLHLGKQALFFSRLISKSSQSHLAKLVAKPEYKSVTIRNWKTTMTLIEKLNEKG